MPTFESTSRRNPNHKHVLTQQQSLPGTNGDDSRSRVALSLIMIRVKFGVRIRISVRVRIRAGPGLGLGLVAGIRMECVVLGWVIAIGAAGRVMMECGHHG